MLNYLLEHEGKGGLFSYLRKKLWATDVYATFYTSSLGSNELFSLSTIDIRLTKNGFDHLDDVLAAVFSYLKFLQKVNLNEPSFHEYRSARVNVNRFSKEPDASENVSNLSNNMMQYPSEYIVLASDYSFNCDVEAVKKTIDHLNVQNFNIMITLKRQRSEQMVYKSTDPWFGIMYTEMDMPTKWIELHQKAQAFPEFALPETNPFIADNFTLLNTGEDGKSEPHQLFGTQYCELWYRKSKKNSRPHAEFLLHFSKRHAETSIDK